LKKNYFSSHRLPKQQSTSFWSQGILGVNVSRETLLGLKWRLDVGKSEELGSELDSMGLKLAI
jgi:hypothetical protein